MKLNVSILVEGLGSCGGQATSRPSALHLTMQRVVESSEGERNAEELRKVETREEAP
jgi:hypothetical protein